ncbi:MAG TPA: CvpA family protein [Bryobacteraceae bacterium]|nr:CvpA family protein [Bryobacteraceae bacterium]
MNWVDISLLLVLGLSILSGLRAGFARVGIGFISVLVGMFFGFWSYGIVAAYVRSYVSSRHLANLTGFLIIFLGVVLLGAVLGSLIAKLFKWAGLSWFDRLLGGLFGVVRGFIIAAALVTVWLAFWPPPLPHAVTESRLLPYVIDVSDVLAAATPHEIKDAFHDAKEKVQKAWALHPPRPPQGERRE